MDARLGRILVPGKIEYPETGIRKIYARKSVPVTNPPLVFPDTSRLGRVLLIMASRALPPVVGPRALELGFLNSWSIGRVARY